MLDRRRFLAGTAGAVLGGLVVPRRGLAQGSDVSPLGDRLSLVTSGRTNVLALRTPDGLVVVDSGAPESSDPLMASLRRLSPSGRVATAFNTHYHAENTGANGALRQGGAAIVAHENTRLWMATPVWMPAEDRYRPARPTIEQPGKTFYVDGSMNAGSERIDYGYLIEAHTSGDIYVFFRESNVLAVGDVASPVRDPELDYFTGAWIGGRVDAMDTVLKLANEQTGIVPAYGPVMTRAEFKVERDMMEQVRDRLFKQVREGDGPKDMLEGGVLKGLARTWTDPYKFLYDACKGLWAHEDKLGPNVV
jgi:cyclase